MTVASIHAIPGMPAHQPQADLPAVDMAARQRPLQARYRREPAQALIRDRATTRSGRFHPSLPLHGEVTLTDDQTSRLVFGVHEAVGGESDAPVPGQLLCAAIASCLDSTLRILANRFGIGLRTLEVEVDALVDVRGTLQVDCSVPVGFQAIEICVRLDTADSVPVHLLERLVTAAEKSCVVIQTLRNVPRITIGCEVSGTPLPL